MEPVKRLFTLKEASIYLGISLRSIRELIWSGDLPYVQPNRKMYVDLYDLEQYVEDNKKQEKE